MKIKLEIDIPEEILIQAQNRANYLNDKYQTGTMIKAKDVLKELIQSDKIEALTFKDFEDKLRRNNLDAYKEIFN